MKKEASFFSGKIQKKVIAFIAVMAMVLGDPWIAGAIQMEWTGPLSPPTAAPVEPAEKTAAHLAASSPVPTSSAFAFNKISDIVLSGGGLVSLELKASSPRGEVVFESAHLPAGASLNSHVFEWHPEPNLTGSYPVTFIADDGESREEQTITFFLMSTSRSSIASRPVLLPDQQSTAAHGWVAVIPTGAPAAGGSGSPGTFGPKEKLADASFRADENGFGSNVNLADGTLAVATGNPNLFARIPGNAPTNTSSNNPPSGPPSSGPDNGGGGENPPPPNQPDAPTIPDVDLDDVTGPWQGAPIEGEHNTFVDATFISFPNRPYVFGTTAAFVDYNADGREDVYIGNPFHTLPAGLDFNPLPLARNILFQNQGAPTGGSAFDRIFTDVTITRGAETPCPSGTDCRPNAVVFGDMDNDGDRDLFLAGFGGNFLLRASASGGNVDYQNVSGAQSQLINPLAGSGANSRGAVFADFNNDGYLDIYVAAGLDPNLLYLNSRSEIRGATNDFVNVADLAQVQGNGNCTGAIAFDVEGDGDQDLYVYYLNAPSEMYINQGPTAEGIPQFQRSTGLAPHTGSPASVKVADINNDGLLDLFISDNAGESKLYINDTVIGTPVLYAFTNRTALLRTALGVSALPPADDAAILDFDNNGVLDIYLLLHNGENVMFKNNMSATGNGADLAFTNATANELVAFPEITYSIATGDYNDDGRTDMFLPATSSILYRNISANNNHFIKVVLKQSALPGEDPNERRDATGTMVEVMVESQQGDFIQTQQVLGGNGHSQDSQTLLFGLNNLTNPVVTITAFWPGSDHRVTTRRSNDPEHGFSLDSTVVLDEILLQGPAPVFLNPANDRTRDAAIGNNFFFVWQVDSTDNTPPAEDLQVTLRQFLRNGTPVTLGSGTGAIIELSTQAIGKWRYLLTPDEAHGFAAGDQLDITFRVTDPLDGAFSEAVLHVNVKTPVEANIVPILNLGADTLSTDEGEMVEIPVSIVDLDNLIPATGEALAVGIEITPASVAAPIFVPGPEGVVLSEQGKTLEGVIRWTPNAADVTGEPVAFTITATAMDQFSDPETCVTCRDTVQVTVTDTITPVPDPIFVSSNPANNATVVELALMDITLAHADLEDTAATLEVQRSGGTLVLNTDYTLDLTTTDHLTIHITNPTEVGTFVFDFTPTRDQISGTPQTLTVISVG